jgi:cysteinyl-tRNA synthetase
MKFRFCASIAAAAVTLVAMAMLPPAHSQQLRLPHVRSWAVQLQAVDPLEIAQSPYDLVVVDYALEHENQVAMPPEVVDIMRRKPNGSRRFVLAYLSIGEAENFRFYWRDAWLKEPSDWLGRENRNWPGNYAVKYWDPAWQALIFGSPAAYLDQILDAGFDGVFLDGIDVFERLEGSRPTAMTDMVDLIAKIASYTRARRKNFLVIPQNGDRILDDPRTLKIIDAFAREDLNYNEDRNNAPNPVQDVQENVSKLKAVTHAGKPVLVIEYVSDPELATSVLRRIASFGFVGYVAARDLRRLNAPTRQSTCRPAEKHFSLFCFFTGCAPRDCSR